MNQEKWLKKFSEQMEAIVYSECTKKTYGSCIKLFLEKFKEYSEPEKISADIILKYLLTFTTRNTRKHHHSAIKLFYKRCVHQEFKFKFIPYPKKETRLPVIIDNSDIQKIIDACHNVKHKAIILTLFGTAIRISELINIKLSDINGEKGLIKVLGKGNKERYVCMNEVLYEYLKFYWKKYRTKTWLFENDLTHNQYTASSVRHFLKTYQLEAKVNAIVTPHKFRHSAATELLANGTNLKVIKDLLGHKDIRTTSIYTHVNAAVISKIESPLNNIIISK